MRIPVSDLKLKTYEDRIVPHALEESLENDREDTSTNSRAGIHASVRQTEPLLEPVCHHHIGHGEKYPTRELAGGVGPSQIRHQSCES